MIMANISQENINSLAQEVSSLGSGDYIYVFKAGSQGFSRISKDVFLAGLDVASASSVGISSADTNTGDLEFADEAGNVVLRVVDGHIKTQGFDSSQAGGGGSQDLSGYQEKLVSGTNIKYINGQSILGSGNLVIQGGGNGGSIDLKIFFVGNSYSMDAISYVPWILEYLYPQINLTLGCAWYSQCTLQDHKNMMTNDSASYRYYKYSPGGIWVQSSNDSVKMSDMLADEAWDIVSFQQYSGSAGNYGTISPYLGDCISKASELLGRTPEYWWLMGQRNLLSNSPTYSSLVTAVQSILQNFDISMVIPVATAIENARTDTTMNNMGSGNAKGLTADSSHLQEGLPCMIASYAVVMSILEHLGIYGSVISSPIFDVSDESIGLHHKNGSIIGMTDELILKGKKCAILASKHKYEIKSFI